MPVFAGEENADRSLVCFHFATVAFNLNATGTTSLIICQDRLGTNAREKFKPWGGAFRRLFLHASRLAFDHPFVEGGRIDVVCPLPTELSGFLKRLPCSDLTQIPSEVLPP